MRWMVGALLGLAVVAGPAGIAMAGDVDDGEEYPPGATIDTVDPGGGGDDDDGDDDDDGAAGGGGGGGGNIPSTGNSDTGTWVTLGAGAVAVGGILVAATARRRRYLV